MVVSDGENHYAVFEPDWNGEYWEATLCTEICRICSPQNFVKAQKKFSISVKSA